MVMLLTMSFMPLAEVKAHLSEFVQRVGTQHERITVTAHGRPAAVLSDDDLRRQLDEAEADIPAGRLTDADDWADAMRRRRSSAD